MPSAVHVANRLSELTAAQLAVLLEARPQHLGKQRDLHDLADTLLGTDSISAAIRSLSRPSIESLREGSADDSARDLLLADDKGRPFPEVTKLLPALDGSAAPNEPAPVQADGSTMVHTVCAIRDVLAIIEDTPLSMSATGGVLKAEEKSLASILVLPEPEVSRIVWLAERAGLARTVDRRLRITERGKTVSDDLAGLWSAAVLGIINSLPVSVRRAVQTARRLDRPFCEWVWAARDDSGSARLDALLTAAELTGLIAGSTTPIGRALLAGDTATLENACVANLPPLLDSVYVLDDLSIIAPGPITTRAAKDLDRVSVVESRGLAAKRRLDSTRVLRSIAAGETVESLIAALAERSLTPLTSAVTSTITDIAQNTRFVFLNGTGTDTAAKASHAELGAALVTDPRLQRLAPVSVDDVTVLYGASRDRVETALIEGGYTVVTHDRTAPRAASDERSPVVDLAESLAAVGLGSSHLERALLVAGKAKSAVTLVVDTGNGLRTITLEPRQVANGRVRGLDTASDVERTLPISAIREVKTVGDHA